MSTERTWNVYDGTTLILELSDRPGPLISTAPLPPGVAPVEHPFLSGTARSAIHEDQLRQVLEAATDVEAFVEGLEAAGFAVQAQPVP